MFVNSFSFEEMRIRYERRDPRPEDIRRIDELKTVVDSQEQDIYHLTEQLRELQLQLQAQQQQQQQQMQINQQNSNQSNKNRNRGKNNSNNNSNKNNRGNNAQQMKNNQQQQQQQKQQQNAADDNEQQHLQNDEEVSLPQATQSVNTNQRLRPPPLIKTVIYEEENEDELYEEQLREERERQNVNSIPIPVKQNFTVELVPESPDYLSKDDCNGVNEEISEALIVPEHEIINQRVIPSPTPDDLKNREINVEVISTIEPSYIQVIPVENGLDLELD